MTKFDEILEKYRNLNKNLAPGETLKLPSLEEDPDMIILSDVLHTAMYHVCNGFEYFERRKLLKKSLLKKNRHQKRYDFIGRKMKK